jgi:hypothetical protein
MVAAGGVAGPDLDAARGIAGLSRCRFRNAFSGFQLRPALRWRHILGMRTCLVFCGLLGTALARPLKLDSNWIDLFNGKDLANWYAYIAAPGVADKRYENPADDPGKNFRIANGEIVYTANAASNQTLGYLGTDSVFSRYQFRVEYKLGPTCAKGVTYCKNSGLLYHMVKDGIFGTGIECNLYWNWPTAIAGLGDVTFAQARTGFGNFEAEAAKMAPYAPTGEWNVMEIRVWGDSAAQHIVNGHLGGWVAGIKHADGSPLRKGAIALQIEGNDVSFRNPRVRDLDRRVDTLGCTDKRSSNYDPKATKDDGSCAATAVSPRPRPRDAAAKRAGRLALPGDASSAPAARDLRGKRARPSAPRP